MRIQKDNNGMEEEFEKDSVTRLICEELECAGMK